MLYLSKGAHSAFFILTFKNLSYKMAEMNSFKCMYYSNKIQKLHNFYNCKNGK